MSKEAVKQFITDIQNKLKRIMESHMYKGNCTKKEAEFFDVKNTNPIVGRPVVAGYNWILTPVTIFVVHYLNEFYSKFENILTDSFSLIKLLEKTKTDINCFFFIYGGFQKSLQ